MRVLIAVVGLVALFLWTMAALAHDHGFGSWIGKERIIDPVTKEWCCDANDCAEETSENVRPVEGGYLIVSTGEIIARERVIWRSPGAWWRCRRLDGSNTTRCLIGPPQGS